MSQQTVTVSTVGDLSTDELVRLLDTLDDTSATYALVEREYAMRLCDALYPQEEDDTLPDSWFMTI